MQIVNIVNGRAETRTSFSQYHPPLNLPASPYKKPAGDHSIPLSVISRVRHRATFTCLYRFELCPLAWTTRVSLPCERGDDTHTTYTACTYYYNIILCNETLFIYTYKCYRIIATTRIRPFAVGPTPLRPFCRVSNTIRHILYYTITSWCCSFYSKKHSHS